MVPDVTPRANLTPRCSAYACSNCSTLDESFHQRNGCRRLEHLQQFLLLRVVVELRSERAGVQRVLPHGRAAVDGQLHIRGFRRRPAADPTAPATMSQRPPHSPSPETRVDSTLSCSWSSCSWDAPYKPVGMTGGHGVTVRVRANLAAHANPRHTHSIGFADPWSMRGTGHTTRLRITEPRSATVLRAAIPAHAAKCFATLRMASATPRM